MFILQKMLLPCGLPPEREEEWGHEVLHMWRFRVVVVIMLMNTLWNFCSIDLVVIRCDRNEFTMASYVSTVWLWVLFLHVCSYVLVNNIVMCSVSYWVVVWFSVKVSFQYVDGLITKSLICVCNCWVANYLRWDWESLWEK